MSATMERNVDALLIEYHRNGDRDARERLLIELMPLVRFDVDRGVEFSSYAVPTIVGEIRRHFRDKAWAMHVPRRLKELSVRLSRMLDELTTELGRSPTVAELAEATGVEEEDVIDALDSAHAYSTRSL